MCKIGPRKLNSDNMDIITSYMYKSEFKLQNISRIHL